MMGTKVSTSKFSGSWPTLVNQERLRLMGEGRKDDTLLFRRTRPTVLTEKRGHNGKQSVVPSSRRDAA